MLSKEDFSDLYWSITLSVFVSVGLMLIHDNFKGSMILGGSLTINGFFLFGLKFLILGKQILVTFSDTLLLSVFFNAEYSNVEAVLHSFLIGNTRL